MSGENSRLKKLQDASGCLTLNLLTPVPSAPWAEPVVPDSMPGNCRVRMPTVDFRRVGTDSLCTTVATLPLANDEGLVLVRDVQDRRVPEAALEAGLDRLERGQALLAVEQHLRAVVAEHRVPERVVDVLEVEGGERPARAQPRLDARDDVRFSTNFGVSANSASYVGGFVRVLADRGEEVRVPGPTATWKWIGSPRRTWSIWVDEAGQGGLEEVAQVAPEELPSSGSSSRVPKFCMKLS